MRNLGICYETGNGVRHDLDIAFKLFLAANDFGDLACNYYKILKF